MIYSTDPQSCWHHSNEHKPIEEELTLGKDCENDQYCSGNDE